MKPIEYEKKEVVFLGEKYFIDERSYIPNIETEQLVQYVFSDMSDPTVIIDVGTGCGCIAISLARHFSSAQVFAIDVDENVLDVAQRNVDLHHTANVVCIRSNYMDDLNISNANCIVANLPWGDESHLLGSNTLERLQFEPHIASFHPKGILGAYEELVESIKRKDWKTTLYFESGTISKGDVQKIIPTGCSWQYIPMQEYSITKISFT